MDVRPIRTSDSEQIREIYNWEVLNALSNMDLVPRTPESQELWMHEHSGIHGAIAAAEENRILGFASLSPYRPRPGYSTSVENSIYVHRDARRNGVGIALLSSLVDLAANHGFHTCIARIIATQAASVELHRKCGFELVGVEREIGRKFGQWIDVALMQRML